MNLTSSNRPSGRAAGELRPILITPGYSLYAEGSALIEYGNTKVLCCASAEQRVPFFLKNRNSGWVTAEYGMLPRATATRNGREAAIGRQAQRSVEIQRLIGRSLRGAVDLEALNGHTLTIDCDVLQADGGTRVAAITGGWVALKLAANRILQDQWINKDPVKHQIAAVSAAIFRGAVVIDPDYEEDSAAAVDMNIVLDTKQHLVELQSTGEKRACEPAELQLALELAQPVIASLMELQNKAVADAAL